LDEEAKRLDEEAKSLDEEAKSLAAVTVNFSNYQPDNDEERKRIF
jgi:hypothetical protein